MARLSEKITQNFCDFEVKTTQHFSVFDVKMTLTGPVADPGSVERVAPGVLGACPQDFFGKF